jgi:CRISPR-associated protein Cst1
MKFTGNPFVDAGIAAMCAAADVESPDQLDDTAIDRAVCRLINLMTSDSAFVPRTIGKKTSRFSTSEMSVIFPNGVHANPSGKTDKKKENYISRVKARQNGIAEDVEAGELCYLNGQPAAFRAGKSEFPLLDSKDLRNFHPEHRSGHPLSAENALAIEFFPLSVLRTGTNEGRFWFIHTANAELAILCSQLTQQKMQRQVSGKEGLGFFGEWDIASKDPDSAFIALIHAVMTPGGNNQVSSKKLKKSDLPVTAYVFSNDNRSTEVRGQDLPHELFDYFLALRSSGSEASKRFKNEILLNESLCQKVASKMLEQLSIAKMCCMQMSKQQGQEKLALKGGWQVHSIYVREVLGMGVRFVRAIEEISENLFHSDNRKKALDALRGKEAKDSPSNVLLRFVQWGAMSHEQYQLLAPPTDYNQAYIARDYLLAALFERKNLEESNKDFLPLPDTYALEEKPSKHPLLVRVERIGEALLKIDRGRRAVNDLSRANRPVALRGVFLDFIARQCATYDDFLALFPLEPGSSLAFQARDYLLAFLYDRLRDERLPAPEPLTVNATEGVIE